MDDHIDYIHQYPAVTGLVQHLEDWMPSSCWVYLGLKEASFLDRNW